MLLIFQGSITILKWNHIFLNTLIDIAQILVPFYNIIINICPKLMYS